MTTEYRKTMHIQGLEEALCGRRYLTPCDPEMIVVK